MEKLGNDKSVFDATALKECNETIQKIQEVRLGVMLTIILLNFLVYTTIKMYKQTMKM